MTRSKTVDGSPRPAPAEPRTRVGVISLGCAKNLVDTEVMLGHLDRAGCEFVQDPQQAEVVLVNTCGFIQAAREESVRTILEAAQLKHSGSLKRLVVAGCMVQRYRDELRANLPEVDAFVDLDELERIVERAGLSAEPARDRQADAVSDLPLVPASPAGLAGAAPTAVAAWTTATFLYDHDTPRRLATPSWSAFIKIAEGCNHTCAFCAIPTFRGVFRSRDPQSIVSEARRLAGQGVREINLIAQDSSHYGRDSGIRDGLAELLEALERIEPLRWIRVHYLYPNTVTDRLIETMRACSRVVPYVDLPLQHAHSDVLARMRRGGSSRSHLRLLDKFRAALPEVAIRTTLIVGFPGETEREFATLVDFVREARFDHLGVFTYSHEERTAAGEARDDVPAATKQARRERLMRCQQEIVFARNAEQLGRRVVVLVEGAHAETEHLLVGRTAGQAPDVDGQVLINDGVAPPGSFATVELTDTAGYDLVGRIVEVEPAT